MESVWITLTAVGTLALVAVSVLVVEALIGDSLIASSGPVDVAAGASERVPLAIPRHYVENLAGERPRCRGDLTLRVADH
jgi:hypothetical protein